LKAFFLGYINYSSGKPEGREVLAIFLFFYFFHSQSIRWQMLCLPGFAYNSLVILIADF
jgi:hypothetical protein